MFLIPLSFQLTLRDSGAAPPFEYKKGCSDKMISLFDDKRPKLNKKASTTPPFSSHITMQSWSTKLNPHLGSAHLLLTSIKVVWLLDYAFVTYFERRNVMALSVLQKVQR